MLVSAAVLVCMAPDGYLTAPAQSALLEAYTVEERSWPQRRRWQTTSAPRPLRDPATDRRPVGREDRAAAGMPAI